MATLPLRAPRQTTRYVCDTCRANLLRLSTPAANPYRTFSTASPSNDRILTRSVAPSPFGHRADIRPLNVGSSRRQSTRRHYSAETPPQAVGSGFAALPHRRLISLAGSHAAKFLQGLITNNVDQSRQAPFYAAFLDARGRVLWDVFIWVWPQLVQEKEPWACYIEVDESEFDSLKRHLKRHKLRSQVQIADVGADEIRVWAAWGSEVGQRKSEGLIAEMSDPRGPDMRRYLASANAETIIEGAEPVDVREYHLQRYRNGIPEGPQEIARENALPMECNIDLWHGIDFKKGCYVGQELTIRTKHTGIVRKRILPVHIKSPGTPTTLPDNGTDIKQLDENGQIKKGRAAGKFIGGIGDVGLALCRLENMTSMEISAEGGTWKPGMEFGCETSEGIVKFRPVLHDWFVQRERELWDKNRLRF